MDIVTISTVGGLAVFAAGMGFMIHELRRAPAGREDAQGFHFVGHEPLPVSAAPDQPANENALKLTVNQCAVLCEMGRQDELAISAEKLANRTGLSRETITSVRKQLANLGLAQLGYLAAEQGQAAGRGYWLTDAGLDVKERLLAGKVAA